MITIPVKVTYRCGVDGWGRRWEISGAVTDEVGRVHQITVASGQWDIAVAEFRQEALMHLPEGARITLDIRDIDTGSKVWASPVEARVGRDGQIRLVPRFPLRDEPYCMGVRRYA